MRPLCYLYPEVLMYSTCIIAHYWAQNKFGRLMKTVNTQVPERISREKGILDVHSVFSTIQGEGPFCGHPAVFVRLAGCNLQCPLCDTEYTNGRAKMDMSKLMDAIELDLFYTKSKAKLIVITGGEPFRQPEVVSFINFLIDIKGFRVQVETNGTMQIPLELHNECIVVCSPKAAKIHPSVAARANAFKYVLQAGNVREEDGLPLQALEHRATPYIARPPVYYKGPIYLQPADEKDSVVNQKNIHAVVKSAIKHNYIVQLQIHKYLGVD